MSTNYWMVVLLPENFAITRKLGFKSQGLKTQHPRKVQRVGTGDRILYYLSRERRFAATATVTSACAEDPDSPWQKEGNTPWGYRVDIQPDCVLAPEDYMDAHQIAYRLDYVRRWRPEDWHLAFQESLHLLPKKDFQLLEEEMRKVHHKRVGPGASRPPRRTPVASGAR